MIEIGIKRNIAPLCGKCKTPLECKSEDDNPHDAESNILVYVEPCPCTGLIGNSMMGQAVMDEANNEILRLRESVRYWSDRSENDALSGWNSIPSAREMASLHAVFVASRRYLETYKPSTAVELLLAVESHAERWGR